MTTFIKTYDTAQTDLAIITPATGKSIYLWQVIVKTDSNVKLDFATSGINIVDLTSAGEAGVMNVDKQGAVDESLTLNCGAGTTVKILYDEI